MQLWILHFRPWGGPQRRWVNDHGRSKVSRNGCQIHRILTNLLVFLVWRRQVSIMTWAWTKLALQAAVTMVTVTPKWGSVPLCRTAVDTEVVITSVTSTQQLPDIVVVFSTFPTPTSRIQVCQLVSKTKLITPHIWIPWHTQFPSSNQLLLVLPQLRPSPQQQPKKSPPPRQLRPAPKQRLKKLPQQQRQRRHHQQQQQLSLLRALDRWSGQRRRHWMTPWRLCVTTTYWMLVTTTKQSSTTNKCGTYSRKRIIQRQSQKSSQSSGESMPRPSQVLSRQLPSIKPIVSRICLKLSKWPCIGCKRRRFKTLEWPGIGRQTSQEQRPHSYYI